MPIRKLLHEWWKEEDRGYISPCWIWQGHTTKKGYGLYQLYSHSYLAHRYVYEIHKGRITDSKLELDHLCKVILCVRPEHLELVTKTINRRRRDDTKITLEIANQIRERYKRGDGDQRLLAKVYGVNQSTIQRIINNKLWK